MRYVVIAIFLCACAPFMPQQRLTKAEVEAGYAEFVKEFNTEHYEDAKLIVNQKKIERKRVVAFVVDTMWQKTTISKDMTMSKAKEVSKLFQLDHATETIFSQKVFDFFIANSFCEMASDTVLSFDLGPAYMEKAISCAHSDAFPLREARLACKVPNIRNLQSKLVAGWVLDFANAIPSKRDYISMGVIAAICPLTRNQYAELFAIGLADKKPEFAKVALDGSSFNKTSADFDNLINLATDQYQCALAATVALKYGLPDPTVEAIFLKPKCFGGNLREVDLMFVPKAKEDWFFSLSLKAQEFVLARRVVKIFSLGEDKFDEAVNSGLLAHDYDDVLGFEPWDKESSENYRDRILNKVLDSGEEWAVTRFVTEHSVFFNVVHRNAWIERAFLHAFRRGDLNLAVDIVQKHTDSGFGDWAVRQVFEAAIQAKNADTAMYIAKQYHLDKDKTVMQRIAMLNLELIREKERKRAQRLKIECESEKGWRVERCK